VRKFTFTVPKHAELGDIKLQLLILVINKKKQDREGAVTMGLNKPLKSTSSI